MNVAVVGPGAMGCLFAVHLARAGIETSLVDHRPDRAERLRRSGVAVQTGDGTLIEHPRCSVGVPPAQDLVIVFVKSHCTAALELPGDAPVLTLQNGMGNAEALCARVGPAWVLAGATSEAATLVAEGRVRHAAAGQTEFGAWGGCPVAAAVEALSRAGFNTHVTDCPRRTIWEKTAVCAGINPLTALLGVPNGALLDNVEVRALLRDLVGEAVDVAAADGCRFDRDVAGLAEKICADTAENLSSMLQDVRAGRQTEIEAICGEIVRRGERHGVPTPRICVIRQLVKGLERH